MNIIILCSGLNGNNVRLQPWRYLLEVGKGLYEKGHTITLVSTDSNGIDNFDNLHIINIHGPMVFKKNEVIKKINDCNPDLLIVQTGPTTVFVHSIFKKLKCPKIALWLGTKISTVEVIKIGLKTPISNISPIITTFINSIIPNKYIGLFLSNYFFKIVTLNYNNRDWILNFVNSDLSVHVIPPGMDEFWFERIDDQREIIRSELGYNPDEIIVLYMGGASEIRGPGMLVKSLSKLDKISVKLLMLIREHKENKNKELCKLEQLVKRTGMSHRTNLVKGYLSIEELKKYICISDIVVLPFRMVQADTPLSIIECMCQGKTIISSNTDGITELLCDGRGKLIKPGDVNELTDILTRLVDNPEECLISKMNSLKYIESYPKWREIKERWCEEIKIQNYGNDNAT